MDGADFEITLNDAQLQAGVRRANTSLENLGAAVLRIADRSGAAVDRQFNSVLRLAGAHDKWGASAVAAFKSSELAAKSFGSRIIEIESATKSAAGTVKTLGAEFVGLAASIGLTAAAGAKAAGIGDSLGASYRAIRLILSPTWITAGTLAIGAATEATIRLANARSKLLAQEAFFAAKNNLALGDVSQLSAASISGGKNPEFLAQAALALRSRAGAPPAGVSDADRLGNVAKSIGDMVDPVEKAHAAIALFGVDMAQRILPDLNLSLKDTITGFKGLNDSTGNLELAIFRQNVEELSGTFSGLKARISAAYTEAKNFLALGGAYLANSVFFPAFTGRSGGQVEESERQRNLRADAAKALQVQADAAGATAARNLSPFGTSSIISDLKNSREGIESELSGYRQQRDKAINALKDSGLSDKDRFNYQAQVTAASAGIKYDQARIDLLDQQKKSQEEILVAEKRAAEFRKTSLEAEYEGVARILVLRDEELKRDGLSPKARTDIEAGYSALLSREQKKQDQGVFNYDISRGIAASRINAQAFGAGNFPFGFATEEMRRQTGESGALFGVDQAGYQRDAQLRALESFDAQTLQQKVVLEERKFAIEQDYLLRTVKIKTDAIERENNFEIDQLKDQLQAKQITEDQFSARRDAIVASGAEKGRQLGAGAEASIGAARDNAALAQMKLVTEEAKRQFDGVQQSAETLVNTLLTKPGQFGKELGSTIHAAILKPITEGIANTAARALTPMIYGNDGQSGLHGLLGGAFGGNQGVDPVSIATDINTTATIQNTAALIALRDQAMSPSGGGGGVPSAAFAAQSGGGGLASLLMAGTGAGVLSLPSSVRQRIAATTGGAGQFGVASQTVRGVMPGDVARNAIGFGLLGGSAFLGGGSTTASAASGGLIPGMLGITYGDAAAMSGYTGTGAGSNTGWFGGTGRGGGGTFNPFAIESQAAKAVSGGGGTAGLMKSLSGLKGTVFNDKAWNSVDSTVGGGALGVATSPLATSAGLMLTNAGILGNRRGTWGGIGEATGGLALAGAGIGFGLAGPLGAGLGAAAGAIAGFGIGVGEKLAGVESPQNEAKRLIRQIYNISIDNGMANQIVQLAQQKYGNKVSIAVRDPDIRKMLQLYAEGTGQKFPMSQTTPVAGSLQYQNGQLQQVASFQNNSTYSYQSNLPVAGGFSSGGYSGPTMVSLNLNGQSAADVLEGRVASTVTPSFIQDGYAASQSSSYGRTGNAATLQAPGLITA